jgi:uncharacterized Zn-finger protein
VYRKPGTSTSGLENLRRKSGRKAFANQRIDSLKHKLLAMALNKKRSGSGTGSYRQNLMNRMVTKPRTVEKPVEKKEVVSTSRKPVPMLANKSVGQAQKNLEFGCGNCPAAFKTPYQLKIHEAFHSRESTFKCELCSYSVDIKDVLVLHMRAHTEADSESEGTRRPSPKVVSVQQRAQPTFIPAPARRYSRPERNDDAYTVGNPGFNYSTYLKNGRPKLKRYKCQKCPFSTEKRDQYHIHVGLHGSNQTYTCTICQYSVVHYANFKQHSKLHGDQVNVSESLKKTGLAPAASASVTSGSAVEIYRCVGI